MIFTRFFKKDNVPNWFIELQYSEVDKYTGVVVTRKKTYITAGDIYFSNKLHKEVELTLVDSEDLKTKVCIGIKVVG